MAVSDSVSTPITSQNVILFVQPCRQRVEAESAPKNLQLQNLEIVMY